MSKKQAVQQPEPLTILITHAMRNKKLPRTHYVGRPSVLGNPYTHLRTPNKADITVANITEAVYAYDDYITEAINEGNERIIDALNVILDDAEQGGTIHLCCWCKDEVTPYSTDNELCHADIIRDIILTELDPQEEQ